MQARLKPIRMLTLALTVAATSISTTAQTASRAGHVTIIAIMPEMLTLSINVSSPAHSVTATGASDNPGTATGVTTGWSLLPGRDKVAAWAVMHHLNTPVIVATALPMGIDPFPDRSFQGRSPYGFAARPNISSTPIVDMCLTDANRRGTNTAILSDLIDTAPAQQGPANTSPEVLKIQVQPVL